MSVDLEIRSPQSDSEWEAYYFLRWSILRQPWGQPRGSERDDDEDSAVHRCALVNGTIVGVGRLHFLSRSQGQIRYMATQPNNRNRGVGRAILSDLEQVAVDAGASEIVLNARESYLDFYMNMGYTAVGIGPTLYNVVKHRRMLKSLEQR